MIGISGKSTATSSSSMGCAYLSRTPPPPTSSRAYARRSRRGFLDPGLQAASGWHLGQVVAHRHLLGQVLFRDAFLDLQAPFLHPADVGVDDAAMVFPSDQLVALRVTDGVLHLLALERLDHSGSVLAGLVAGSLDRLLEREHVFP